MHNKLRNIFENKKILIIGFGREGKSSYNFIKKNFPSAQISVADKNEIIGNYDFDAKFIGDNYLDPVYESFDYDFALKSPGVRLSANTVNACKFLITAQISIFMDIFKKNIIGVTGTKGKSTTTSMIYKCLKEIKSDIVMGGNIGIPVFDIIDKISSETIIVLELSCHQLQFIKSSPHIAVLLNIFPEHLDYYDSFDEYAQTKRNIYHYQNDDDFVIYPQKEFVNINCHSKKIPVYFEDQKKHFKIKFQNSNNIYKFVDRYEKFKIIGKHNFLNLGIAIGAVKNMVHCHLPDILDSLYKFQGLEHRLEYFGEFHKIKFYNDSISTIPEAAIVAMQALGKNISSLILGGYNRSKDVVFNSLVDYIKQTKLNNIFLLPETGAIIFDTMLKSGFKIEKEEEFYKILSFNKQKYHIFFENNYENLVKYIFEFTPKNTICLFSPAASSYNMFKNFEERGRIFKDLVVKYKNTN